VDAYAARDASLNLQRKPNGTSGLIVGIGRVAHLGGDLHGSRGLEGLIVRSCFHAALMIGAVGGRDKGPLPLRSALKPSVHKKPGKLIWSHPPRDAPCSKRCRQADRLRLLDKDGLLWNSKPATTPRIRALAPAQPQS